MPQRDLSAVFAWIDKWERKLSRLFSGAFLENASVTNGRLRFIGGLLRLDSGARLEGVGTMQWSGPVTLDGDVEITKTLLVRALTRLVGELIVDGGKISAGQIRIEGGKIYAGGMVIDPTDSGGSVTFPGGAKVTANDGGAGVKVDSGAGWTAYVAQNGIRLAGGIGQASYTMTPDTLAIGADVVRISADELRLSAPTATAEEVTHMLTRTSTGEARWIPL